VSAAERAASLLALVPAAIVLVRLFLWKRGVLYALFCAGVTWVVFASLALALETLFGVHA
jgi:hypothetical protein